MIKDHKSIRNFELKALNPKRVWFKVRGRSHHVINVVSFNWESVKREPTDVISMVRLAMRRRSIQYGDRVR